jgi:uncharacterized protein YyaL (SSP411 family)
MHTNRLAQEKSPYLLQHAHNPVDWYPWGDEAFEKAARENKPVFLSVGYSTCHWCHVMERESFEHEGIADYLNQHFVSVKVDREERPDIDRVYMLFVQASTGSGGWPMSVFLTPERKPFFGGTYFPPDNRYGRPGFRIILERLNEAWTNDRSRVDASSAQVLEQLKTYAAVPRGGAMSAKDALEKAFWSFRRSFDSRLGGFGNAPKFPRPSVHNFLVRYYKESGNEEALEMVLLTLREMAKGGMNDQLGGGFHRYSVDERWFVPHFEKMLYDQAQLAVSYLEAFQITRDGLYAAEARNIFTYVMRDMTDPRGGFYSAEDADSAIDPILPMEKGEGAFYIWARQELDAILGAQAADIFAYRYGVRGNGNVENDPHSEFTGRNILFEEHTIEQTAQYAGLSETDVRETLRAASAKLMEARDHRPRPLRDDKVLAAWNGMMISAFAKGAQILNERAYAEAARKAIDFARTNLWDDARKVLMRRHRAGESAIDGFLDDYAFIALGLLDLYETTFDPRDFAWATELAERALALFEDRDNGGFFSTAEGGKDVVLRLKDDYDGAEPSGNSAMAMLLLRLSRMTDRAHFLTAAERTLAAFASRVEEHGNGVPQMLVALSFALARPREIVLAGPSDPDVLATIRRVFLPNAVILRAEQSSIAMPALDNKATVYVCENFACQLPTSDLKALGDLLE